MNTPDFSYLTEYQGNSLTMIVTSFFIGIVLASVAMLYHQLFLGGIVRRILEKKALSEDSALTADELGYSKNNFLVRFALRDGSTFAKTVHRTGDEVKRYYIPEELRIRSEIRFREKGNGVFGILLTILLFLVVGYVSLTVIPWFIDAINNIFS